VKLAPFVDVMIGNEEDFTAALGFEVEGWTPITRNSRSQNFRRMIEHAVAQFRTLRSLHHPQKCADGNCERLSAVCYAAVSFIRRQLAKGLEIFESFGGGASFAPGSDLRVPDRAGPHGRSLWRRSWRAGDDYAGDTTMVTLAEVERVRKVAAPSVARKPDVVDTL